MFPSKKAGKNYRENRREDRDLATVKEGTNQVETQEKNNLNQRKNQDVERRLSRLLTDKDHAIK